MKTRLSFRLIVVLSLLLAALPVQAVLAAGAGAPLAKTAQLPLPGPDASVALGIHPLERVMIGEDFDFYLTFDNLSAEEGYGPFIDLIFPSNGADGAAGTDTPDGIDFVSAKYDGYTLPATSRVFPDPDPIIVPPPATTCVSHPFAVDASGSAMPVCGTPGDTLVVLDLPFSSITPGMPELYVKVTAHVSNLADVDTPLTILGRGGYRFGADNLNNPVSDPAILDPSSSDGSGWPSLQVTPRVIHIDKTFDGPKECPYDQPNGPVLDESQCYGDVNPVYESVSGPNFPRQYDINIYVAAGQTVTDLYVTDYFPNNLAYLSVTSLGGGTLEEFPMVGAAANPPDNELIIHFDSLTGSTDIVVKFFIPELDADGNPVLAPATGASAIAENTASALGDWTPIDTRDPGGPDNAIANGPCPGTCVPLHELNIRSIAVQKSVSIQTDTGVPGYSPGDLLKYTLDFQISDYFAFGDLVLTDVLTDGQLLDTTTAPAFTVSDWNNPTPLTGSFVTGNDLMITDPGAPTGETTLAFNISTAMNNAGAADGILQGGESGTTGAGPATGQIIFYAQIQESFSYNYPSGDPSVDHGDVLFNSVTLEATLRDETDVTTVLNPQKPPTDNSIQKMKIVHGGIDKSVYAVNGSTTFSSPFTTPAAVQPNDTITFRLTQTLPSSDSDRLVLTDYLPLPIFDAFEVTTFDNVTDASVPAAGHAKYGPNSTLNTALLAAPVPTISVDTAANSPSFDFGSFDDPTDTTSQVDVLFTVTVSNAPYADGAVLTNLGVGFEDTTNSYQHIYVGSEQFTLKEPGISLRKGVVATNNPAAVFVPAPPGPITFNAPGSSPAWSGVIASGDNSANTNLINSDIDDVNGGDLMTFAVVLENLGHSSLGAFDIGVRDTIPANMGIPAGGINLQVRRGDGAAMSFTPIGSTATEPSGLFDDGILFDDESQTQGAAHVYSPSNGQNLIVITYDLQVAPDLDPGTVMVNTATLLSYAGTDGGPNHVGATPTANVHSDNATATIYVPYPVVLFGGLTSPTDGAVLTVGPSNLVIEFSKKLQSGGNTVPGAADNIANYLLVEQSPVTGFQTVSCEAGPNDNDTQVIIRSAVYTDHDGVGPFVVTLTLEAPLPYGEYRLFVCGTTSIEDTFGKELNDGKKDTAISFKVVPVVPAAVPATGFAPNRVTTLPAQTVSYADLGDLWLEIPALGVQMPIVGVPQTDGAWDVSWLGNDAGWLNGSSFPTWAGNSVLTAHVYDASGKPGPFAGLNRLWYGSQVIVHAWGGQYVYEVRSVMQVAPGDTAAMMKHQELPWLTLVTCRGYDEASNSYKYRVLVRAVLVKVK